MHVRPDVIEICNYFHESIFLHLSQKYKTIPQLFFSQSKLWVGIGDATYLVKFSVLHKYFIFEWKPLHVLKFILCEQG